MIFTLLFMMAIDRGEAIFTTGGGVPAIVANGDRGVPVAGLACSTCHGDDGRGRREAGLDAPDITWPALSKPYDVTRADGRTRRAYSARLLIRAMTMGIDSAGNALGPAMPRYQLTSADADALVAFLQRLDDARTPGVSDDTIDVAVMGDVATPAARLFQRRIVWHREPVAHPLATVARAGAAELDKLAARGGLVLIELEGAPPERFPDGGTAFLLDADDATRAQALGALPRDVYVARAARQLAAAPLLVEALSRTGRNVTAARLTEEVRRLLGYGEHQCSERAVQILRLDAAHSRFEVVTPWLVPGERNR